jgi:hypothetical protein
MSSAGLQFVALEEAGLLGWTRPAQFDFLDALTAIPLGDSEILHLSHYLPIAIALTPSGLRVVGLVHAALVNGALVTPEGRWRAPYMPMALRCLPFRRAFETDQEPVEIAPALASEGAATKSFGFWETAGKPQPEFDAILLMLDRLGRGVRRLSNTARTLLAANVLTPLAIVPTEQTHALLVVSPERLAALPPIRAAALTADACSAFELATASIFSQRWLIKGVVRDEPPPEAAHVAATPAELPLETSLNAAIDQPIQLDDSDLFSIEAFFGATHDTR